MSSLFDQNIRNLKGVGEKRARLFEKLGAPNIGALLCLYPRSYQDLSNPYPIRLAPLNEPCAIRVTVLRAPKETRIRSGMTLYKALVTDGEIDMEVTFFNNPYVMNMLRENETYIFYGKVNSNYQKRFMSAPEFFRADGSPSVRPVYSQTEGLTSKMVENAMHNALGLLPDVIRDPVPDEIRRPYSLCQLRFALTNIHFPKDMEALRLARRRLIFDELLFLQLGLLQIRGKNKIKNRLRLNRDLSSEFYALLPFMPTKAQRRAVSEAVADMMGDYSMSRLVQGDVGSGKTAVAAALCYCAVKDGMQAALMAPTEILAQQHFASLSRLLGYAGIHTALLTGSLPAAKKRLILEGLKTGQIQLVIGTHALLSDGVEFRRLGLVITDEQHRFGVAQRAALSAKGDHPHMLVMSATPIPRTLALMIYGDLDISILDELPPGRQPVSTFTLTGDKRQRAFRLIRRQICAGRQCYIICPAIDEGLNDMASVTTYAAKLSREWLTGCRIGVLHGRMKAKEKESVMAEFAEGKISVLVSTTVVEVGVDVPNATIMMIENAERYGLSQLHQLRGRVGRGKDASACILISDAQNDEAVSRLKIMCETSDGFKIAEQDLKLRGPGDFFGSKQHGLPDLKIADMTNDTLILTQAQSAAKEILRDDPGLEKLEHRGLRAFIRMLFDRMVIS